MVQIPVKSMGALTINILNWLKRVLSEDLRVIVLSHGCDWFQEVVGFTNIAKLDIFEIQNGDCLADFILFSGRLDFGLGASIKDGSQQCLIQKGVIIQHIFRFHDLKYFIDINKTNSFDINWAELNK